MTSKGKKHRPWFTQEVYPGSDYSNEELELLRAVEKYKKDTGVRFPSVTDIMQIMKALGYRKVVTNDNDVDS